MKRNTSGLNPPRVQLTGPPSQQLAFGARAPLNAASSARYAQSVAASYSWTSLMRGCVAWLTAFADRRVRAFRQPLSPAEALALVGALVMLVWRVLLLLLWPLRLVWRGLMWLAYTTGLRRSRVGFRLDSNGRVHYKRTVVDRLRRLIYSGALPQAFFVFKLNIT